MSSSSESPAAPTQQRGRGITLFLCGDVMTGRGIDQVLRAPCDPTLHEGYVKSALGYVRLAEQANGPIRGRPVDDAYVWGDALGEFDRVRPDARIINLETSVTRSDDWMPKGINYRMSPENIGCITAAHIDCCVLANNHVLDWGERGLCDTLDALGRAGLRTAGAGRNLAEAQRPAIIDRHGLGRVLVFSVGTESSGVPESWAATRDRPGVFFVSLGDEQQRDASVRTMSELVQRYRQPNDLVVASIHWGSNWGYSVPPLWREFAHRLVDEAGVSLVHGHSSHHPRSLEVYKDRLILYGCGDFLNDYEGISGYEEYRQDLVLMYWPRLDAATSRLVDMRMTPMQIRRLKLNYPSVQDARWLYGTMKNQYKKFGCDLEMRVLDDGGGSGDNKSERGAVCEFVLTWPHSGA